MKFFKKFINRFTIISFFLLLQIIWILIVPVFLSNYYFYLSWIFRVLSIVVVALIINKDYDPAMKLAWIVPILAFPIFGWALYLVFGTRIPSARLRKKFSVSDECTINRLNGCDDIIEEIRDISPGVAGQIRYAESKGYTVYKNTEARYFPLGDDAFPVLLEELKKAKSFIFIEFFIVSEGYMWSTILDVLREKVKEGVEVRMIYDDFGSINYIPSKYFKTLEEYGIKCIAFNRFKPFLSVILQNRDHRKIVVIDGNVGFTGGYNLADEYINRKVRFGHWKDNGVMLKGEAVTTLTLLFLEMWNCCRPTDEKDDIDGYLAGRQFPIKAQSDGYIMPYGDSPFNDEIIGENIYINIISNAKNYVYIFTPYLVIDTTMQSALELAAKRGVDVRIVIPHIPDKKIVYQVTKSYCPPLLKAGVKIYEYTPGFIHAKSFICDDEIATVGTINMDYRSLVHHFECGCFFYKTSIIKDIYDDYIKTFEVCDPTKLSKRGPGLLRNFWYALLRLFSPLM